MDVASRAVSEARPYQLARQPQRPGELCEEVVLSLGAKRAEAFEARAAAAGLPAALWLTLAIETQRCLRVLSCALGDDPLTVSRQMQCEHAPRVDAHTRLADYATALRAARPRPSTAVTSRLAARPSLSLLAGWRSEAARANTSVESWAIDQLTNPLPERFVEWEADAAIAGHSLLAWMLLQAACAMRASSTAAQPIA